MKELVRFDGVLWEKVGNKIFDPICPIHRMEMDAWEVGDNDNYVKCSDCEDEIELPRSYSDEIEYIERKLKSKEYSALKVLNLDDEQIPVAEVEIPAPKNSKYFVTGRLMKSRVGLRLVVYAGEKGKKQKTQIFVEPEIKRLAFDQKDTHPSEVFTKLEATFNDGSTQSIEKELKKRRG